MNYAQYLALFDEIASNNTPEPPYDNPDYLHYLHLNQSRMTRWNRALELDDTLVAAIKSIRSPQSWIILAEPWCGDAAPTLPFLVRLAGLNSQITYDIQLRDQPPFLIDSYLTNGGKSIPKLVVRDASGNDLFTWGPRPATAQALVKEWKASGIAYEVLSAQLQQWYNNDKGRSLQAELLEHFRAIQPA